MQRTGMMQCSKTRAPLSQSKERSMATTNHRSSTTEVTSGEVAYRAPDAFTRRFVNPLVAWLTRRGVSVWGSRVLEVRGRSSGQWRATPVNLLEVDGSTFLVSPRGQTQWVRNLRAAGGGRLRLGRRTSPFTAVEVRGADAARVLRPYLRRWGWEVGRFFDGVGADASDEELLAVADRHPVFALTT
jgi:deazaflavin-dependent oxidoreductase (nitroreductase family)